MTINEIIKRLSDIVEEIDNLREEQKKLAHELSDKFTKFDALVNCMSEEKNEQKDEQKDFEREILYRIRKTRSKRGLDFLVMKSFSEEQQNTVYSMIDRGLIELVYSEEARHKYLREVEVA